MTRQRVSELLKLLRGRWEVSSGGIRHIDEIESDRGVADKGRKIDRVLLAHVDTTHAHVGEINSISLGKRVAASGLHNPGYWRSSSDGHEERSLLVGRRSKADREPEGEVHIGEPFDLLNQSHRADGYRLPGDRVLDGVSHPIRRDDHVGKVEKRLSHPHEHRPRNRASLRAGDPARLHELIEDLPRLKVSSFRHLRGGAEGTAHHASNLRGEADRNAALLFEWDKDGFDELAVVRLKEELLETIDYGSIMLDEGERGRLRDQVPFGASDVARVHNLSLIRKAVADHGARPPTSTLL